MKNKLIKKIKIFSFFATFAMILSSCTLSLNFGDNSSSETSEDNPSSNTTTSENHSETSIFSYDEIIIEDLSINASSCEVFVGDNVKINININPSKYLNDVQLEVIEGNEKVELRGNELITLYPGKVKIIAKLNDFYSNELEINICSFIIGTSKLDVEIGETCYFTYPITPISYENLVFECINDSTLLNIYDDNPKTAYFTPLKEGTAYVRAYNETDYSNLLEINCINSEIPPIIGDYENISKDEFYADYERAASYEDAMERTKYCLMSGSIDKQDQVPTVETNRPKSNGKLIHNSSNGYTNSNRTYRVYDAYGNFKFEVYKGAAYVTLEDVAAYVYAFGDIPANYTSEKSGNPSTNEWGEYLRLNNSYFSGSTTKYPYEPKLPRISGCGGDLNYYEIDIGTTGTDCDPSYPTTDYNNGQKITRGAARIVYSRFNSSNQPITDLSERYVFYTYNHYNDFQEYLNYANGWGDLFGNITGGGSLSSKTDYNPTEYIESIRLPLY